MNRVQYWPVALLLLTTWGIPVRADGPASTESFINDGAKLFGKSARAEADHLLSGNEVGLFVETVTSLEEKPSAWRFWNRTGRLKFFAHAANDRADQLAQTRNVDGVFVLISEKPQMIKAIPYGAKGEEFSQFELEALEGAFRNELRKGKDRFDPALLAMVHHFNAVLHSKGPIGQVHLERRSLMVLLGALGAVALILLVLARRSIRARQGGHDVHDSAPAVLGTLFGTVGAFWTYDGLLKPRIHHTPAPSNTPNSVPPRDPARIG
jgi:hypothetical protein